MGRDTGTVGLSPPPSSARQHGAVRRVAEEQELGDGFSRPSSRPPCPRSPCQQLRQAVVRPFKKRNGGGLNFKRNGGVPDECRGKYDTSIYTQLDNICEDCYNLYKEADVHQFCRADCFSTSYFQRCLQALLLEEDASSTWSIIGRK